MKKISTRRLYYRIRHKYFTLNNAVIAVAFAITVSWVWGSLGVMERNYTLQKEVDSKKRELQLAELATSSLEFEKRYYQTREYQELAVREHLGLVLPGEKVLVLPANSQVVKAADASTTAQTRTTALTISNFRQWVNFLFGGNSKSISD
ncbi:hypothetical protein H7X69_00575 [Candidatus Saccharibacteria bacterium]|nr:hypothetical protein [Candidatus Saccharibacteria bacterium]